MTMGTKSWRTRLMPVRAFAATTGSPLLDRTIVPGLTIASWIANGSFVPATTGFLRLLAYGGGGGAGSDGGGGAGGYLDTLYWVEAGRTYAISIGAGGIGAADTSTNGGATLVGSLVAAGGGGGAGSTRAGLDGASGGGAGRGGAAGAALGNYGPTGYPGGGTNGVSGGTGGGAGGPGPANSTGWAPGRRWLDGKEYCRGGSNLTVTSLLPVPANSGFGANAYNLNGSDGGVKIALGWTP